MSDTATLDPTSQLGLAVLSRQSPAGSNVSGEAALPVRSGDTKAQVQQAVREEWLAAGYPAPAVDGIMRRINVESGFNPFAVGDSGTSISLYQHHADRAVNLSRFLVQNGVTDQSDPVKTARLATKFAVQEMAGGDPIAAKHRDELIQAKTPEAAYGIFTSSFARS